jgi:MFS transporter, PAT family, beta-lactamase induction signal transducer AmpG
VAALLAVLCLAWLPFIAWGEGLGRAQGLMSMFFTLVFVASAVVLLAASALWPRGTFSRAAPWVAVALLAIYARRFFEPSPLVHIATAVVACAGGALLLWLSRQPWHALKSSASD